MCSRFWVSWGPDLRFTHPSSCSPARATCLADTQGAPAELWIRNRGENQSIISANVQPSPSRSVIRALSIKNQGYCNYPDVFNQVAWSLHGELVLQGSISQFLASGEWSLNSFQNFTLQWKTLNKVKTNRKNDLPHLWMGCALKTSFLSHPLGPHFTSHKPKSHMVLGVPRLCLKFLSAVLRLTQRALWNLTIMLAVRGSYSVLTWNSRNDPPKWSQPGQVFSIQGMFGTYALTFRGSTWVCAEESVWCTSISVRALSSKKKS